MALASQADQNNSKTFLKTVKDVLGWKYLKKDVVIDIGCGEGRTAKAIVGAFPEVRKIVAIDISEQRLNEAQRTHSDRKIQYERADILNKLSIARWIGEMDKAVSVFCFNCLEDVRKGYENMFCLLKPAGEAAFLQSLRSGYYQVVGEIMDSTKWRGYFTERKVTIPASQFEKYSSDHYKKMLEEIGFEVVDCYEEVNVYARSFNSDEDCKNVIYNSCQLGVFVPQEKRSELRDDIFNTFLKHNTRNSQGHITLEHTTFSAFLRKPKVTLPAKPAPEKLI